VTLDKGVDTRPLFAGMPNDQCQCHHWGYIISGTMLVRGLDGDRTYVAGETHCRAPGHNLEALEDAHYLEISPSDQYDALMAHCKKVIGS
jgi:hypothetical protein